MANGDAMVIVVVLENARMVPGPLQETKMKEMLEKALQSKESGPRNIYLKKLRLLGERKRAAVHVEQFVFLFGGLCTFLAFSFFLPNWLRTFAVLFSLFQNHKAFKCCMTSDLALTYPVVTHAPP